MGGRKIIYLKKLT